MCINFACIHEYTYVHVHVCMQCIACLHVLLHVHVQIVSACTFYRNRRTYTIVYTCVVATTCSFWGPLTNCRQSGRLHPAFSLTTHNKHKLRIIHHQEPVLFQLPGDQMTHPGLGSQPRGRAAHSQQHRLSAILCPSQHLLLLATIIL